MANNCVYDMKIVGSKESCEEWVRRMKNYDVANHFYRISSCEVYAVVEEGPGVGTVSMYISGDCVWSLYSCCVSDYTEGKDLFAVNTSELHIKMEAWSNESGIGFQEHYIYDNGLCIVDEEIDWTEWCWNKDEYPTYEQYVEYNNQAPPEDKFVFDGDIYYAEEGGFDNYGDWSI